MDITLQLNKDDRSHLIDNTDTRALSEQRLRFVYDDMTDQEVEDFLDVFYEVKSGYFSEYSHEPGDRTYRVILT